MKKLFNNSTKRARIETQAVEQAETQTTRKSKRKALRGFAFGGVALMMATAGVFAFAPLGAVQPTSLATSQPTDVLVTPQEDDPVLFTTEDGLEIKWGNAASLQGGGKESGTYSYSSTYSSVTPNLISPPSNITQQTLSSGNLKGFPYFTTKSGSTTYTWVIIGRNSNVTNATYASMNKANISGTQSSSKIEYKTLNDWKAKIGNSDTYKNFVEGYSPTYKSFFNNTYETTSPAGAAINNNGLLSAVTARNYSASASYTYTDSYMKISAISAVKTNAEIPSGCVLVLANGNVTTGVFNNTQTFSGDSAKTASYTGNTNIRVAMNGYYTNGSYGLSAIKSRITGVTLKSWAYNYNNGWAGRLYSETAYVFPLGGSSNGGTNFIYSTYLTAAQVKLGANQWTRGMSSNDTSYSGGYRRGLYIDTSGNAVYGYTSGTYGYRPAFCLKVT